MRVAEDESDAGYGGQFFRGPLGVTACHQYLGRRVLAVNAANGGAYVLVGRSRDRARVQDDDLGVLRRPGGMPTALRELALDGGAVGLGCAATEVLNEIRRHGVIISVTRQSLAAVHFD